MNYGSVITRAFHVVARRPYIWLLGLLAGGAMAGNFSGSGSGYRRPAPLAAYSPPDWTAVQGVWNDNWGWIVAALAALALIGLILFVLGCIATGGIVHAAVEHDGGREYGLRSAWRAGYATGWRIAGLRLLTFLLTVAPGLLVGALALAAVAGSATSVGAAVTFGLAAGLVLLVALAFWLTLSVAFQLAARLVVLEGAHVAESLSGGFRMIRWHFKEVALGWLILLGLSIAAGIGMAIVAVLAAVPAALLALAGWLIGGMTGVIITGSFAAVFFLGVVLAAAAAFAGYSSVYWTLLFTGIRALPAPAPRGAIVPAG